VTWQTSPAAADAAAADAVAVAAAAALGMTACDAVNAAGAAPRSSN